MGATCEVCSCENELNFCNERTVEMNPLRTPMGIKNTEFKKPVGKC